MRLLVLDDIATFPPIAIPTGQALGWRTDHAADCHAAQQMLARSAYDGVVLRISPATEERCRFWRDLPQSSGCPAIILVCPPGMAIDGALDHVGAAVSPNVVEFVHEPLVPARLLEILIRLSAPSGRRGSRPAASGGVPSRDVPFGGFEPTADDIARAIARGDIVAKFQPKVALTSGHPVGAEALARWNDPIFGEIPPDVFVPIAERTGLIADLTMCVLAQSLEACTRWRSDHPSWTVAVNISPILLADPGLPEKITAELARVRLAPGALTAEITEGTVISNPRIAGDIMARFRSIGVGLSIDDFGTGHATLLSLLRLPFTEMKIDRSFIAAYETDPDASKIVRAMIALANELDLTVVAEGVETEATETMLREAGCDIGQGWYFGRAMPADPLHASASASSATFR